MIAPETFADCSPVFIVSNGRSGSTLLRLMMNAHPALAIMGEVHFFNRIVRLRDRVPDLRTPGSRKEFFRVLPRLEGMQYLADLGGLLRDVARRLDSDPDPSYGKFYRYFMEAYARKEGARRFGDKSLDHIRRLDEVLELFPNAKIVHLVRDPRAVVESMLRMPWAPDDAVVNSAKWRVNVWYARRLASRTDVLLEVRYEDLVASPERELRRICEFIGEPYDPAMLRYHETAGEYIRNEPWKEGTTKPVDASSLDLWRDRLAGPRVVLIEAVAGRFLADYGYAKAGASLGDRLAAPFAFVVDLVKYARYKFREARRHAADAGEIRVEDGPGRLFLKFVRSCRRD